MTDPQIPDEQIIAALGEAIADLQDELQAANERIAALEAERDRAFKAGVEVAAIMDRNSMGDD